MLDNLHVVSVERQRRYARIVERIVCDIVGLGRNRYTCKILVRRKRIPLYLFKRVRQNDACNILVIESISADIHDVAAKVYGCKIDVLILSKVFDNRSRAVCEYCDFVITVGRSFDCRNTGIVTYNSVIPILIEIHRQTFCLKINTAITCS